MTIADACMLGRELGASAAFLAGGTEVLPDLERGRESARHFIALDGLHELRAVHLREDRLVIGAMATVAEIASSDLVREHCEALSEAAHSLGSPQIRSRATIGGNFCRAVACADLPPAAMAASARVRLASPSGEREVSVEEFLVGARRTSLDTGELLTAIVLSRAATGFASSFARFGNRRGPSLAVASVAAGLRLENERVADLRIVLGAVAPSPVVVHVASELARGEKPTSALIAKVGAACVAAARPISDIRGSAEFRRELVGVLARRAFERAIQRATRRAPGGSA